MPAPYFERLGFACPPEKDAAEFLQEVTLPARTEEGANGVMPTFPQSNSYPTPLMCSPGPGGHIRLVGGMGNNDIKWDVSGIHVSTGGKKQKGQNGP